MSVTLNPVVDVPEREAEDTGVRPRRWTREEYHRMAEYSIFQPGERLELIRGVIYEKCEIRGDGSKVTAQNTPHFTGVRLATKTAEQSFGPDVEVRSQGPLDVGKDSDPEPDVLVVVGSIRDYEKRRPTPDDVLLLIEVSDTTLRFDQTLKASLYAEAGIKDYWIVNINARCLEVRRDPIPMPGAPHGFGYRSLVLYMEDEIVAPLAAPQAAIRVSDLLPRAYATE